MQTERMPRYLEVDDVAKPREVVVELRDGVEVTRNLAHFQLAPVVVAGRAVAAVVWPPAAHAVRTPGRDEEIKRRV